MKKSIRTLLSPTKFIIGFCAVFFIILPKIAAGYILSFFFILFIYVTLAESFDILTGYTGYINLGHIAFFGIGAYTLGILFSRGVHFYFCLALSPCAAVLFAFVVSFPFFRLKGAYFSIAMLALVLLLMKMTINFGSVTGGAYGLLIKSGSVIMPSYYLALILATVTILTHRIIGSSKFGLALKSIRDDEEVAQVFGINSFRHKLKTMVISAAFSGLAGGIYVYQLNYISPQTVFGTSIMFIPSVMALFGGSGIWTGPLVGTILLTLIDELIWTKIAYFHLFLHGAILVFIGLFLPQGIVRSKILKDIYFKLNSLYTTINDSSNT